MSVFEPILFDPTMKTVVNGIYDTARRHAAYTYNIANASTPGFTPIVFADELEKARRKQGLEAQEFNLEDEMAKLSRNNLKHSALVKILTTKYAILRRVATQGKS